MSLNLTMHDCIVKKSIEFLNGLGLRNLPWLKLEFLRDEFYQHINTYPDYKKYLNGEDFTQKVEDEKVENKRMRKVLKNLKNSDKSLEFLINICSSELNKLEHQNRICLTDVS